MPHLCSARLIVDRARHLIGQHAFVLINEGRTQTLELWQRCLPHLIVEQNAWLLYWLGLCRLPFSTAESRIYFEKAFNIFEAEENITGLHLGISPSQETEAIHKNLRSQLHFSAGQPPWPYNEAFSRIQVVAAVNQYFMTLM